MGTFSVVSRLEVDEASGAKASAILSHFSSSEPWCGVLKRSYAHEGLI